uniref:F-box domain-containing protein n=1 Tax=Strongyloides venezuelensis TaxID=75913 RepID=A0A0K0FZM5_STRVS
MTSLTPNTTISSLSIEMLPEELLILIFSDLNWKDIINIKKTCKLFYTFVESNLHRLQKPKLQRLLINSTIESDTRCKVSFIFKYNETKEITIIIYNNDFKKITQKFYDVDYLFKRMNLSDLHIITINSIGNTIVFDILNNYFPSSIKVGQINIKIKNCPVFRGFSKFIEKISHMYILNIEHLCFGSQKIPSNYTFPIFNGLEEFNVKECGKTKFFNARMLEKVLKTSPTINQLGIFTERNNLEYTVINSIRQKQNSKHSDNCIEDYYAVALPNRNIMNTLDGLKKYYKNSSVKFDEDLRFHGSVYVSTECNSCEKVNYIHFIYLNTERFWEECC